MATAPISDIEVRDRSRKVLRNLDSLARSIRERGLLHPVVVRHVGRQLVLVAGQRRIEAVRTLGWTEIPVTVVTTLADEMAALYAEGDENTEREPFTPAEAVEHRRRIREVETQAAKERQGARTDLEPPAKLAQSPKPHERTTRARTAKATGYGHATLDKAEAIVEAAEDETQPEPVREAAKAAVVNLSAPGAKVDREFKAFKAEAAKHNPDLAAAGFRKSLTQQLVKVGELVAYDIDRVAEVCDSDLLALIEDTCGQVADWHTELRLRTKQLRVVQGGR